jgi:hypothetical protein
MNFNRPNEQWSTLLQKHGVVYKDASLVPNAHRNLAQTSSAFL